MHRRKASPHTALEAKVSQRAQPHNNMLSGPTLIEPFLSIRQAADQLGLKYHHLQRGVRRGVFPAYRVAAGLRVRLSEIVRVIEAARVGGGE